jgi:mannose-6-phosphate isomerase-like protein (cupin superfamily)
VPSAIDEVVHPRRIVATTGDDGASFFACIEPADEVGENKAGAGSRGRFLIWSSRPSAELFVRVGWSRAAPGDPPFPPGPLHGTETTDVFFVMAGRQREILEDGAVVLGAGDVVVRNGNAHSRQQLAGGVSIVGSVVFAAAERSADWSGAAPPEPAPDEGGVQRAISEADRPRLVVTGTNAAGRSACVRCEPVDEVDYNAVGMHRPDVSGTRLWRLWRCDRLPPPLPSTGVEWTAKALRRTPALPESRGYLVNVVTISSTGSPTPFLRKETVDVVFVMAGEAEYALDGGETVQVRPGDVLIQHEARHSWRNGSGSPLVLGAVSIGGGWSSLLGP